MEVSERIVNVQVLESDNEREGQIVFSLKDGREVRVPLSWSWRLSEASPEERQNFTISPRGYGVHWPDVDEDLSARGALRGTPAPGPGTSPPPESLGTWSPGRIKQLRKTLRMTQLEFANRMGLDRQATVSDWENGRQEPSKMARRLLDRLAGVATDAHEPATT